MAAIGDNILATVLGEVGSATKPIRSAMLGSIGWCAMARGLSNWPSCMQFQPVTFDVEPEFMQV